MDRREALSAISFLGGSQLLFPALLISSCRSAQYQARFFAQEDLPLLHEIGETILPKTESSPGAKEALVGNFIDTYVADCYTAENQQIVQEGLITFQAVSQTAYGTPFLHLSPEQRHTLLTHLDARAQTHDQQRQGGEAFHYFTLIKNLVLFAYFTSQTGATQALRHLPIPGSFKGDIALGPEDKAWSM